MNSSEIFLMAHLFGITLHLMTVAVTIEHFISCMRERERYRLSGVPYDRKLVPMDGSPFGHDIYLWPHWLFSSIVPVLNWVVFIAWLIWYFRRMYRMRRRERDEKAAFAQFMSDVAGSPSDQKRPLKEFKAVCDKTPKKFNPPHS